MMMTKRLVTSIAAVLAIVGGQVSPASGARNDPSFAGSNCTEAVSVFFLDPEVLRPYVPEAFEVELVLNPVPLGELAVATTTCEDLTIGKTGGSTFFSEVGIYIKKVDDSPGNWHYYGLWHASTRKQLARSLSRLGITAPFVKDATFTSTTGTADATASVPWERGAYDVQLITPTPTTLFRLRPSVWWYSAGKDRYVRVVYAFDSATHTSGTGTLEAAADSPLAEILGTTSRRSDTTFIARYPTLTATVSRVRL